MATKPTLLAVLLLAFSFTIFGQNVPPAPSGLQVTATECGKISLAWDAYEANVQNTGYKLYQSNGTIDGYYYQVALLNSDALATQITSSYGESGKNYFYKLTGINGNLESDYSNVVTTVFTCEAPVNLIVTNTSCGIIDLAWDFIPPQFNIQGYDIFYSTNGVNGYYNYITTVGKEINTYSYKGYDVKNGVKHFKIKAKYLMNTTSEFSNTAVSNGATCPIVTGNKVTSTSCGAIDLEWNDYPTGINENGFTIYRSDTEFGDYYYVGNVAANVLNFTDKSSSEPNKDYYYRIAGLFFNTTGPLSAYSKGNFSCETPADLQISSVNCGEISLSWSDYQAGINESGFIIYRAESENGYYSNIGNVNADVLSFTDKSYYMLPNKVYFYKISGRFNYTNTQPTSFVSASFSCEVPIGLKVKKSECGSITLEWNDFPSGQNETNYILSRATTSNSYFNDIVTLNANVLTFTDKNLGSQDETYFYKLKSKFNNTETEYGTVAIGNFSCQLPTGLKVVSTSCGKINLEWDDYPSGVDETGYNIYYSTSENGTYDLITSVSANILNYTFNGTNYYNEAPNQNQIYYFKISSKFNTSNTNLSQGASGSFTCANPPIPQFVSSSCGSITISWPDFPTGIEEDGYEIYRSDSEFGYYSNVGSVGKDVLTFTDKPYNQNPNQVNYYKLRGRFGNTLTYISAPTSGSFSCVAPNNSVATSNGCGNITISWEDYSQGISETGYIIYRSDSQNGNYYQIGSVNADILSFKDESYYLNENQLYYYKIAGKFHNSYTDMSGSTVTSFTCATPNGLQVLSNTCGNIVLSWSDFLVGNNETGYIIYRAEGINGYYSEVNSVSANVTTYVDKSYNLKANTVYYYKIKGRFLNAYTNYSDAVSASFSCTIPAGLQITSSACGLIKLNWSDYPSGITENGYDVLRSTSENGVYQTIATVNANIVIFSDNNYGLLPNQVYFYKIRGIFNNTYSDLSNSVSSSFLCPIPTDLSILNTSCAKINLTWTNLYDGSTPAYSYEIYRSTAENGNFTVIGTAYNGTNTYTDVNNLVSGITYFYKIKAKFNNINTAFGNVVSGSYICPKPVGLIITSTSCGKISLSWTDLPNTNLEDYFIVYRAISLNGAYSQIGTSNRNVTNYNDVYYLNNGQTYFYKIAGYFGGSTTELSDAVSGSFTCEIPQGLQISGTKCGSISLVWQDFPNSIQESGYSIYRSTDGEFGQYQNIGSTNADVLNYTDNTYGLYENVIYFYRITARFANTNSAFSNYVSASYICPIPSNLIVKNTSCGVINLSWSDYPSNVSESGFEIYRSEFENGYYSRIGQVFSNILNYSDNGNGALPDKTYYYKLTGRFNNITTSFSNIVSAIYTCNLPFCSSFKSGPWNEPETWSCGRIPTSLDEILINNGHIINIPDNVIGNCKNIDNNGGLLFGTGAGLILNSP